MRFGTVKFITTVVLATFAQQANAAEVTVSSRPGDSHPQALPEPYVNLSAHTAPDVRPFP